MPVKIKHDPPPLAKHEREDRLHVRLQEATSQADPRGGSDHREVRPRGPAWTGTRPTSLPLTLLAPPGNISDGDGRRGAMPVPLPVIACLVRPRRRSRVGLSGPPNWPAEVAADSADWQTQNRRIYASPAVHAWHPRARVGDSRQVGIKDSVTLCSPCWSAWVRKKAHLGRGRSHTSEIVRTWFFAAGGHQGRCWPSWLRRRHCAAGSERKIRGQGARRCPLAAASTA